MHYGNLLRLFWRGNENGIVSVNFSVTHSGKTPGEKAATYRDKCSLMPKSIV